MRTLTYLITVCLLIISSQVFSQTICEAGFVDKDITAVSVCGATDGAIDITLLGGSAPFTFAWQGPNNFVATTEDISDIPPGNYIVTITDANNIECFEIFFIGEENALSCSATVSPTDCIGTTGAIDLTCSGGAPPYDYQWSNGVAFQQNLNGLTAGTYFVTITDANGCTITNGFTVTTASEFCDTVYINPVQATVGNQIRVDFVVENFDAILAMQYTIHYDPSILQIESMGNFHPDMQFIDESNFNTSNSGYINFAWTDLSSSPFTLQDGSVLYSAFFTPIATGASEIFIDGDPVGIEIINANWGSIYLDSSPGTILTEGNVLSGNVYNDENGNCQNDGELQLPFWSINISDGIDEWNLVTNEEGDYIAVVEDGTYQFNVTPINENWSVCNNNITLDINEVTTQDFGAVALVDCPVMEVDMAIPLLLRCFDNTIYVNYCNTGTVPAADAYIEIELDPEMSYVSSEITPTSVNGNLLTFDLGDVEIGGCGEFVVTVLLDDNCDSSTLGQTHCTTATIYPNAPCNVDPSWDGSSLKITGSCDGENVNFEIENIGTENMTEVSSFIVIEDHVMGISVPEDFLLGVGETLNFSRPANGSTYYVSTVQSLNHPGASNPSVAVEGCGTNSSGEISLGIVTQFAQDDQNKFVDIECAQNVGSYDPNDKRAILDGFGEEHLIYANTPMEYMIRFQNTGTFTAFNVVVEDVLSPNFDITSLRLGASSHDYTFSIEDERKLVFTFENINLPDSTADLAGSNGFISYKVDQLLDLEDGTVLENTADIYFDFNEAIVTNTTTHTIGSDFITTSTSFDNELNIENVISVYPNPATENITFELDQTEANLSLEIFDLTGKLILTKKFDREKIILSKDGLTEGMYFYSINRNAKQLTSGKFIFL